MLTLMLQKRIREYLKEDNKRKKEKHDNLSDSEN